MRLKVRWDAFNVHSLSGVWPHCFAALVVGVSLDVSSASAQTQQLPDWAQVTRPVQRLAFVVGVPDYDSSLPPVKTATHDVRAVRNALEQLSSKFQVMQPENTTRDGILEAFDAFLSAVQPNDTALVFFSGHGFERDGINYLVPSGFRGFEKEELGLRAITLNHFMNELQRKGAGRIILLLDACRTDMLPSPSAPKKLRANAGDGDRQVHEVRPLDQVMHTEIKTRSAGSTSVSLDSGFAEVSARPRMLIAYAASPRQPSYSRQEKDPVDIASFFTRNLTHFVVEMKDAPVHEVFEEVTGEVLRITAEQQRPWINASYFPSRFVFNQSDAYRSERAKRWARVAITSDENLHEALCAFAKQFPDGEQLAAAREQILRLEGDFSQERRRCNSI